MLRGTRTKRVARSTGEGVSTSGRNPFASGSGGGTSRNPGRNPFARGSGGGTSRNPGRNPFAAEDRGAKRGRREPNPASPFAPAQENVGRGRRKEDEVVDASPGSAVGTVAAKDPIIPLEGTRDVAGAPVWPVPEGVRSCRKVSSELHAKLIGLDYLFPGIGLGGAFSGSAAFRMGLRQAMRSDLYIRDPNLSNDANEALRSLQSTLHVVWDRPECTFFNLDAFFRSKGMALTGSEFILTLGRLTGGECRSKSLLEIVAADASRRVGNHDWHQDSGREQRTVMLGFPPRDDYQGAGVFSHCVKLSHELVPNAGRERGEVVEYNAYDTTATLPISEEYVVRPEYKEGAEVLVYYDNAHLHSTPDRICRDAIWRFM